MQRYRSETSTALRRILHVCLVLLALQASVLAELPKPQGYLTDLSGVLDSRTKAEIESLLRSTEQKTSAEIALAIVPSLDGSTVEEYANRLFRLWGIGKKGKDNGVLVLVAPTERKMRIEVGYGLEPVLPDSLAGEIIRTDFLPQFRSGDYQRGIVTGVRHIVSIVEANHTLSPEERSQFAQGASERPPALLMIPFFGLFISLGCFAVGLGLQSRSVFPLLWGGIFGGVPFGMSLVPFFNASVWILGPLAAIMLTWGYVKGKSPYWVKALRGTSKGRGGSTGWIMGAGTTTSGGRGSSGGGFGGGSSGGGGASGSW